MVSKYTYIIPNNITRQSEEHEKYMAQVLAEHFCVNVKFVKTGSIKTADLNIRGRVWEMKSPTGNGKHTIQHQFSRANKQSKYIVLYSGRTSLPELSVKRQSLRYFNDSNYFRGIIIISKKGKIALEEYK